MTAPMSPSPVWDPRQYARFAAERARPFHDLMARVGAISPAAVADLGCGPGDLTVTLLERWPGAVVVGIDSSAEMTAAAEENRARHEAPGRLTFETADLRDWVRSTPEGSVDVIVSNATLQWLPDQLSLLPALAGRLRPGGWLAVQTPANNDAPAHTILGELALSLPYAEFTTGARDPLSEVTPADYVDVLSRAGCRVDAWETTYCHLLGGPDAVLEWMKGTGARPVLQALPAELRAPFEAEYADRLRAAFPERPYGTLLPFRRVFAVATDDNWRS